MSTYGGLVRFDGTRLVSYNTENTPGLRTSRLIGLHQTRDGALWIVTEGQGLTRFLDGRFTTYTTADGLPSNAVAGVFELADGAIVADTGGGNARWRDGRFERHTGLPRRGDASLLILGRTADGVTWYRDAAGVHRADAAGRVTRTLAIGEWARLAVGAYEDRRGAIWLQLRDGAGPRRLARLDDAGFRFFDKTDGVPPFADIAWSEDRDGGVWLGLRGNAGALRFDGRSFRHHDKSTGLPGANAERVFQDREGTIWIPTDGGLARLTPRPVTSYSVEEGLEGANAYVTYEDRRGDMWIGGWPGLSRIRNGRAEPMSAAMRVTGRNITALFEDADGVFWAGVWDGGLRRIAGGRTESLPSPVGVVVRTIQRGRDSAIWFGGTRGIARYARGTFTPVAGTETYDGGEVLAMLEDADGSWWLGTDAGILRFHDGRFTRFIGSDGVAGNPIVRSIHRDNTGALWFGTYDTGIYRYKDGRFFHFTTGHGLFSTGAFQILEDADARFWVSSNTGIYRVARADLEAVAAGRARQVMSVPYGTRDGMRHIECNGGAGPSGVRARDGRLWFPTQRGVVVIDPSTIPINTQPPPVVITSVTLASGPADSRAAVEIASGPTSFDVEFAALTFVRPELSRFRYRIDGIDAADRWVDAGHATSARYAQLPYGQFTFQVIAANRDGVWNTDGARLAITVVPPFWRTRWFLAVLVILSAAGGVAIHARRMRLLRREQHMQQAFSRQLIESQEHERRRIAGELHDGLQQHLVVIKNWALLGIAGSADPATVQARLTDIESAAADALGEVRGIVHDLTPYQIEHLGLTRTLSVMTERVAASSGIPIACEADDVDGLLAREAEISLYRVVQEALNNIVKHSGATSGSVSVTRDGGELRVRITDDGRGFLTAETTNAVAERRGGFGLFGMAERVRMTGGRFDVQAAPGRGTAITIAVPMTERG